jgi:hypothetical protein
MINLYDVTMQDHEILPCIARNIYYLSVYYRSDNILYIKYHINQRKQKYLAIYTADQILCRWRSWVAAVCRRARSEPSWAGRAAVGAGSPAALTSGGPLRSSACS